MLGTGCVDLQVNGYLGVSFSDGKLEPESFLEVSGRLLERGVDRFLPTVITSPEAVYRRNLPLLARAIRHPDLRGRIPGLHLEGPFLSPAPGAIGAHSPGWVLAPSPAQLDRYQAWAEGTIRLITVAADAPGVLELIRHAVGMGIAVSLGHHLATLRQLEEAADAGARALTHLGNGVPNLLDRHENPIWAGLACDALAAMIVPDGHHLPATLGAIFLRVKGAGRLIAVSDQSPVAGLPPGRYEALGNEVRLEADGRLHNPRLRCMVGASATLPEGVGWLSRLPGMDGPALRRVTRANALGLLGLDGGEDPSPG